MADKNQLPASEPLPGYAELLDDLISRIETSQAKATSSNTRKLVLMYWQIGGEIVRFQGGKSRGKAIVKRLAADLSAAFPKQQGFSARNIWRMRAFFLAYNDGTGKLPQPAAEIPWWHNVILIEKVSDPDERLWYAHQIIKYGWPRSVLSAQIKSGLFARKGSAVTNFTDCLPPSRSELVRQTLKDPYNFRFLSMAGNALERELEDALLDNIQEFLLEMGKGFAFAGRQAILKAGQQEYYIDLLFYHMRLHCYILVDLKMQDFKPEFAGKMNFYLSIADKTLRQEGDNPSIGLILCRWKNRIVAEYALNDIEKPIGVAEWRSTLVNELPAYLESKLPAISGIKAVIQGCDE